MTTASALASTVTLNDGTVMPMFGLGVYRIDNNCTSLGVANFGVHHLEALAKLKLEKPSVNQIQIHPWHQNKDIVKYCREHDIVVIGYSPLAKAKKIDEENVVEIARKSVELT
ncbi:unnamed protein product [Adineta steineri]|nr:unnamed protein product [Adineta steineri]